MTKTPQTEIEQLREQIRYHDRKYGEAAPEISDLEYDRLMQRLKQLEAEHPELVSPDSPSQRIGDRPVSNLIQVLGAVVAAFLVSLFLLRFVLPRMSTVVRGPYLEATLGNARAETSANSGARVGDRGLAATPLRPSGKMKAGPDIYDVVTEGDFLEKGTPVVISAVRGNVLVVSKEKPE